MYDLKKIKACYLPSFNFAWLAVIVERLMESPSHKAGRPSRIVHGQGVWSMSRVVTLMSKLSPHTTLPNTMTHGVQSKPMLVKPASWPACLPAHSSRSLSHCH